MTKQWRSPVERMRRGNRFQWIVQQDYILNTKSGAAHREAAVSFAEYPETRRQRGRMDILIEDDGDAIAVFEIKATEWDHIRPANIRRNVYRHQKQLWDYVYKYYFVDDVGVTYGLVYPEPPVDPLLRRKIEQMAEMDYQVPVYWYTELSETFSLSDLEDHAWYLRDDVKSGLVS